MVKKGDDAVVLWPYYFDATLSRAEGRRVPAALAVRGPDVAWIEVAAKRANVAGDVDPDARAPRIPYEKSGRFLAEKKWPKQKILKAVATEMRESQDRRESRDA